MKQITDAYELICYLEELPLGHHIINDVPFIKGRHDTGIFKIYDIYVFYDGLSKRL